MYKSVYDLTRDQLDELKTAYFWEEETQDILPEYITTPEQIPDDIIYIHYEDVSFVDDDFFSSYIETALPAIPF